MGVVMVTLKTMETYERLEHEFGEWAGVENVVACASGTAALHLAIEAMRLPPGSEVVTCDFNMIAVPRAIVMAGMKPVFVDCGTDLLIDPDEVAKYCEDKNTEVPGSLISTHIYGRQCDVDTLHFLSELWREGKSKLRIIEDLAEAHGVKPHPRTDAACYSFYRNKIIAGQEGGAVAFRDPVHAAYARQLRSLGFTEAHDFMHTPRGCNYRMSNVHAKLILDSLASVRTNVEARRQVEAWYDAFCPPDWRMTHRDAPWVYDLRIPGLTFAGQDRIVYALNAAGIAARHSFRPMSFQDEFVEYVNPVCHMENAVRAGREVFYLPLVGMTEADCRRAFEIIKDSLNGI